MDTLSEKQQNVLDAIKKFIFEHGYPPTIREIGKMTNLRSSATIHGHLTTLEEKAYIKKGIGKNRTIELLVENEYEKKDIIKVPIISSKNFKSERENPKTELTIPKSFIKVKILFLHY